MKSHIGWTAPMFGVLAVAAGASALTPIGPEAFSGAQAVEDFEGFVAGANIETSSEAPNFLVPGTMATFDFGSGVFLTDPIPNTTADGVFINDFALGPTSWRVSSNGTIASAADVPSGSGYLAINSSTTIVTLTFQSVQTRVGAYVTSSPGPITLEAFDASDQSLGSVMIDPVMAEDWELNFLGIQDFAGIKSISFQGDFAVMDDLIFEFVESPFCLGDADGNGMVNFADITSVLNNWLDICKTPGAPDCPGDADANGEVNFADITRVLNTWLDVCEEGP